MPSQHLCKTITQVILSLSGNSHFCSMLLENNPVQDSNSNLHLLSIWIWIIFPICEGSRSMDLHFKSSPIESNLPILMGLIGVWNATYLKYSNVAILPYCQVSSSCLSSPLTPFRRFSGLLHIFNNWRWNPTANELLLMAPHFRMTRVKSSSANLAQMANIPFTNCFIKDELWLLTSSDFLKLKTTLLYPYGYHIESTITSDLSKIISIFYEWCFYHFYQWLYPRLVLYWCVCRASRSLITMSWCRTSSLNQMLLLWAKQRTNVEQKELHLI